MRRRRGALLVQMVMGVVRMVRVKVLVVGQMGRRVVGVGVNGHVDP